VEKEIVRKNSKTKDGFMLVNPGEGEPPQLSVQEKREKGMTRGLGAMRRGERRGGAKDRN